MGTRARRPPPLRPVTEEAGDLDRSGNVDYFRIKVAEAGRLTVETIGPTDRELYIPLNAAES